MDKIICIAGPTASGKTALSIRLAKALDGEVVSCDSMQLYRGMDIGTAKPGLAERDGVVHHMLDVADPEEPFSAGRYVAMADPMVQDILRRGKTVIVAGGTGLYLDSLIADRTFAPIPATGRREALEQLADQEGMDHMMALLQQADPETAARLHLSDRKRILRALEVFQETGKPMSWHNAQSRLVPPKYHPIWIGLDFSRREDLYRRIDRRVLAMLDAGLLNEARALLDRGVPPEATSMQAIGYRQAIAALQGQLSLEEATARIQQESRRYAKRQLTWFRRNPDIHWIFQGDPPDPAAVFSQAMGLIPFAAPQPDPSGPRTPPAAE